MKTDRQVAAAGADERLLQDEIRYVHADEFEAPDADSQILGTAVEQLVPRPTNRQAPADVPSHLAHLWQTALLKPDEERDLFRRMNYLKYKACQLQSQPRGHESAQCVCERIRSLLAEARQVRNHIVQANMRLVVSIARRFATDCYPFDDLVSDGNLTLMHASNTFEFSRGFRFSTYATHSVQREFSRRIQRVRRQQQTEVSVASPADLPHAESWASGDRHPRSASQLNYVQALMHKYLGRRDQQVLDLRYGLTSDNGTCTLQVVADRLGISRERVRQLQMSAIACVQQFAVMEQAS